MAYGVKYELDFADIKGNKRSVQILKKDYTGDVFAIVGTDNPVVIKYTNDDDFYNPIIGSSCVLNIKTTDTISYDEFENFDEREYKVRVNIGVEDEGADINSPLWELADTNWQETDYNWAESTIFQVYWEGFLVSDTFRESIQSKPFDISLRAIDNLGTLDSYLVPDGSIATNTDGTIKTAAGEQTNNDRAWYYIHKILNFTGLDFDIYVQNNIRKVDSVSGTVVNSNNNLYQDILINEFAFTENFAKKSSKEVLENLLRLTNSRVYQANASWYVVSNSNYYDNEISGTLTDDTGGDQDQDQTTTNPTVTTDSVSNATTTSVTLNGTIVSDRGLAIIERGFYFGTNPLILANPKVAGTVATNFTSSQTSLASGTTYYIAAYAKNNTTSEGRGGTIQFTPGATTTTQAPSVVPTCQMQQPNNVNVQNDDMVFTGQFSDVGTSNVTSYGFYFGTDGNDFNKNTKYTIASGVSISVATAFVGDTDAAPFNLTLSAGTPYFINAWAINDTGEGVSETVTQYTFNAWQLRKQSDNSIQNVPFNNNSRGDNVYISTSGSSSECYTIMVGKYLASLAGLPTISGACADDTTEPSTTEAVNCKAITLYRSDTAFNLCCKTPTSRNHYINGEAFTSSDTTKVFNNDACSVTSPNSPLPAQYLSENLEQYRYWNGTILGNVVNCQDNAGVDVCDPDVIVPDGFLVERDNSQDRLRVDYNSSFSVGERVVLNVETENCFTILEEIRTPDDLSAITIASLCSTQPPTPTEQCPTMTFFARYLLCGGDEIKIMGNNKDVFPTLIKKLSTNECWEFIDRTGINTNDDEFNLGCFPTNKFQVKNGNVYSYPSCDECLGITTTQQVPTTTTTTTQAIYYRQYVEIQTNCSDADQILQVSNTTNSFPNVITNSLSCFRSVQAGGNGTNGDVDLFLGFDTGVLADDCASCNQYISTTTTQTPTTTQAPCKAISASVTTIALNACCGSKSTTIYINANNILLASVIYTNSSCTTALPAGNYIKTGGRLYFWTGNTLVEQDCPQCP